MAKLTSQTYSHFFSLLYNISIIKIFLGDINVRKYPLTLGLLWLCPSITLVTCFVFILQFFFHPRHFYRRDCHHRVDSYTPQSCRSHLRENRGHGGLATNFRYDTAIKVHHKQFARPFSQDLWRPSGRSTMAPQRCLSMREYSSFIYSSNFFLSCTHLSAYWMVISLSSNTFFTPSRQFFCKIKKLFLFFV